MPSTFTVELRSVRTVKPAVLAAETRTRVMLSADGYVTGCTFGVTEYSGENVPEKSPLPFVTPLKHSTRRNGIRHAEPSQNINPAPPGRSVTQAIL